MLDKFPEKLKYLRQEKGLSQRQLARTLDIAESYICHFENGRRKPGSEIVLKIANFFGVTTDVLMRDEVELDTDEPS